MGRFADMNRRQRKRFLNRQRTKFGMAPERMKGKLTPRKTRRVNKELKRQYWDTGSWYEDPMTRREVTSDARRASNLQYRPVLRDLRKEQELSAAQQRNIDMGFDLYKRQLQDIQSRVGQAYGGAYGAVTQTAQGMSDQSAATRAELDSEAAKSAAMRGATAAPSDQAGQASRARQTLSNSFGALIASQGANAAGRLLETERIGDRERISEHLKENKYARDIGEKRREAKMDKRAFLNDYIAERRENERRYGLERSAFGLQKREQKADIKDAKRDDKRALLEAMLDAKAAKRDDMRQRLKDRWDMTDDQIDNALAQAKENRENREGRQEDRGGPSDSVRMEAKEDWESALARANLIVSDKKLAKLTIEQIAGNIESKTSAERLIALAAAQKAKQGYVSPGLARKLRRRYALKVPHHKGGGGGFDPHFGFGS